jgi:hypothetical protein
MGEQSGPTLIQSVQRALRLLKVVAERDGRAPAKELARATRLPLPTTYAHGRPGAGRDGITILMATHEMGFARQVADRVCFLDGGRVLESGPPGRVLGDPVHARTRQFLARVIAAGRLA